MIKNKSTLMKRRKLAIIIAVVAVIVLAVTLAVVMDYARTTTVVDPVDGAVYYIRHRDGAYGVYESDKKTLLPTEPTYGRFVLKSGTLINLDEDGTYQFIVVDGALEGNEAYDGYYYNLMMFPYTEGAKIRQLDVYNSKGSFTFYRYNLETGKVDDSCDFIIKGSPLVAYDVELFTSLYVNAGYTLTSQKIVDPIKNANGEFAEYGLIPETRPLFDELTGEPVINEETGAQETYEYVPAYYVLTDTSGNRHKVIIGDRLVTGDGYYAQYVDISGAEEVKRDAVYVVSSEIGNTMLVPIENYVSPALTYPMTLTTYFDVQNFGLYQKIDGATLESENPYRGIVGFSYIDLSERENTINASRPYVFTGDIVDGYLPAEEKIQACLQALYEPAFSRVCVLAPSSKELCDYGFSVPNGTNEHGNVVYEMFSDYMVSYNYDILDEDGKFVETINNLIYFSEPTKSGTRYAYTQIYSVDKKGERDEFAYDLDMIVELEPHTVAFLEWDVFEWVSEQYVNLNIAFCDKITISAGDYWAEFELDNSASDLSEKLNSELIEILAKDSNGNNRTTFSVMHFTDIQGCKWEITATSVKRYDPNGKEIGFEGGYYEHNFVGKQALCVDGFVESEDGTKIYIGANEIKLEPLDSSKSVTYNRADTSLFRKFYETLLYANLANSYDATEEELERFKNDPDSLIMKMTVLDSEGKTNEYAFYTLTSRKAFITINGRGGFYVMTNRVEKIISDAQKFFANEMIYPTEKN